MSFPEKNYYQEKFSKLALSQEVINSVSFEECEFTACTFIDCKFEKSKFLNCTFTDCILSAVGFLNSRLNEIHFSRCKVIGIDWAKVQEVRDLDFKECQINYSSFKLLKLPRIKIVKCEAREVEFNETDLSHADFKYTDFEGSRFFKTNLAYADFKGAVNYYIDSQNNTFKQTRFSLPEAICLLKSMDIILE